VLYLDLDVISSQVFLVISGELLIINIKLLIISNYANSKILSLLHMPGRAELLSVIIIEGRHIILFNYFHLMA
jgi:hypothetical protein